MANRPNRTHRPVNVAADAAQAPVVPAQVPAVIPAKEVELIPITIDGIKLIAELFDDGFETIVNEAADAKEVRDMASLAMLDYLNDIMSPEQLHLIPEPGVKDVDNKTLLNTFAIPSKDKDGLTKFTNIEVVDYLYSLTPICKAFDHDLDGLTKAKNGAATTPAKYKTKGDDWLVAERNRINGRKSAGRKALVQALKIDKQWTRVENMRNINLSFLLEGDAPEDGSEDIRSRKNTPKPIRIGNARNTDERKLFSVPTFLTLDVPLANKKGGTWQALISTISRESGEPVKGINVDSVEVFEGAVYAIRNFMKDMQKKGDPEKFRAKLLTRVNGADSDEFLAELFLLSFDLDRLTSNKDWKARYTAMQETVEQADEKNAA